MFGNVLAHPRGPHNHSFGFYTRHLRRPLILGSLFEVHSWPYTPESIVTFNVHYIYFQAQFIELLRQKNTKGKRSATATAELGCRNPYRGPNIKPDAAQSNTEIREEKSDDSEMER